MVTAYRTSPHAHKPGDVLARPRGIRVAASADEACVGAAWPFHVYEVDAAGLRDDGGAMRARSCRVVRMLPPEEVLGPRAAEVLAILDRIPQVAWCRPFEREPEAAWLTQRVKEHTAALLACTDRRSVRVANVHDFSDVKLAPDDLIYLDPDVPVVYRPDMFAVIRDEPARRNARVTVGRAAARAIFDAVWDPLWLALRVFTALPPAAIDERDVEVVDEGLAAACGPARESAREFVLAVAAGEQISPQVISDAKYPALEILVRKIVERRGRNTEALGTCAMTNMIILRDRTWMSTARMAAAASASTQLLVNDYTGPDPWRPLLDMWLAGGIPILEVEDLTVVYWCSAFQ